MAKIQSVDLTGKVTGGASVEFLRVEVPKDNYFLVVVRYAVGGIESEYGLRLDRGKQAFIDHVDDEQQEAVLRNAIPEIMEILGQSFPPAERILEILC